MSKYVLVRQTRIEDIDIGHYEFDPQVTVYFFVINADEQIYLRYGGRDDESAESYLNLKSMEVALDRGLEQHKLWQEGKLEAPKRAAARFVKDYEEIRDGPLKKNNCVHCHMIGQGQTGDLMRAGKLDKQRDLWVYPDVKRLGIVLEAEKGLVVKDVKDAAKKAGLAKKDEITHLNGQSVLTFGDLQHLLNKVPRDATELELTVKRKDASEKVTIALDKLWRVTNIERRATTQRAEPFPEFWGKALTDDEKRAAGLKPKGFALKVTKFWVKTNAQAAGLKVDDIVYAVDGVEEDETTQSATLYIKLTKNAGDTIKVGVLRGGKKQELSFKLKARPW
jgi:hypothetical protein